MPFVLQESPEYWASLPYAPGRREADLPPSPGSSFGASIPWLDTLRTKHSMPRGQKFKAEEIVAKLREAEIELARGKKVPEAATLIGVTEQTEVVLN